jgi:hypothetical protein
MIIGYIIYIILIVNLKEFETRCHGLLQVLCQSSYGGTKENHTILI